MVSFSIPEYDDPVFPPAWKDCRKPDVYYGVDFEEYRLWPAVNSGIIRWGQVSPSHFHAAMNGEIRVVETRDMILGRAIHCLILEPERFENQFTVAGKCEVTIKTKNSPRFGQACGNEGVLMGHDGAWMCGVHAKGLNDFNTKDVITADEMRQAQGVAESLKRLPDDLPRMLSRPGWSEASIVFPWKQFLIKGRIDRFAEGNRPLIIDFKKIQVGKGSREECQKVVKNNGYHIQGAIYAKGIEFLKGYLPEVIWLFVEDDAPYEIQILPATVEDIEIGWWEARDAMRAYAAEMAEGKLSGYIRSSMSVRAGALPDWYVKQWREKIEGMQT